MIRFTNFSFERIIYVIENSPNLKKEEKKELKEIIRAYENFSIEYKNYFNKDIGIFKKNYEEHLRIENKKHVDYLNIFDLLKSQKDSLKDEINLLKSHIDSLRQENDFIYSSFSERLERLEKFELIKEVELPILKRRHSI